jgi:hypothetical protein
MSQVEKDIPGMYSKPLTEWRLPLLARELNKRMAAAFLHHQVSLSLDCSNWNEAVRQLAASLTDEHSPWLSGIVSSCECGCMWKLTVALLRQYVAGFRGQAEKPHPGERGMYKGRELELLSAIKVMKERTRWTNKKLEVVLSLWSREDQKEVPKELKSLFEAFRQEFVIGARNFNLTARIKDARARMRNEKALVFQEFGVSHGLLRQNIETCLNSLPECNDNKLEIALYCALWRKDMPRNRLSARSPENLPDRGGPLVRSVTNELLWLGLTQPRKHS